MHQFMDSLNAVEHLRAMVRGYQLTQAVYVAAKLGIADLLIPGAQDAEALAAATHTDAAALGRLMRGLASVGIFEQVDGGRYKLAPVGELLRSDAPNSQRAFVILTGEWRWRMWGDLLYSVQTGAPAHDHVYGSEAYAYLNEHPDLGEMFHGGLIGTPRAQTSAMVLDAYDFAGTSTLVDIGGGAGDLLAEILKHYTAMHGVLFDLPYSIEVARAYLATQGVAERCTFIAGSFFDEVPARGDTFIIRAVMHNWGDQEAILLLKRCREAMRRGSKLLIVDRVLSGDRQTESAGGMLIDLEMLVVGSGRERTQQEFEVLLESAGLQLARVIPTKSTFSILEVIANGI
jgi:hypothetical protein